MQAEQVSGNFADTAVCPDLKHMMENMTMRKILSLLLILSLGTGLLAACGTKKPETTDDDLPVINLALRSGIYAEVIKQCVVQFEADNQVHCNILELGEEELHSIIAQDAGQEEGIYDLCMVDGSWMAEYTKNGVLADLSALKYQLDDDIIPATTQICSYNGVTYLAPFYGNVTVLLYNKAIVKEAGYEGRDIVSLEDLMEICQAAKKNGNYGFMYRGDSANNYVVDFLPILLSYGGWVVDGENRPTVATEEFREAMEFYLELIATGKAESKDNLIMAVANGASAMAVGWPGWYTPYEDSSADYCALEGKVKSDSPSYNANVYGIWAIGIPANSTKAELSVKLLNYLMDPKVQKESVAYGGVPCRYSSLKDEEVLKDFPQYEAVCKALESGIYRPIMAEWTSFYSILGEEMESMMKGEKSVEAGLKDAQNRLTHLLEKKE